MQNILEKDISERLGLSRDEVRSWRSKAPTKYVFQEESKKPSKLWPWVWTEEGVTWLTDQLNLQSDSVAKELYEETQPEEKEVEVVRCDFPNLRFLLVKDKNDSRFSVICKDNRAFRIGVKLTVKKDRLGWFAKRNPAFRQNG
jgi:hypothetical protein